MAEIDADPIHAALADRLGTALRAVIRYDGAERDHAMREDVAAQYTDERLRAVVDHSIVTQLDTPRTEQSFRLGSLEAVVHSFERSWVVQVADGSKRGCLFSVERDDDVSMAAVEDGVDIVEAELRD